MKVKCKMLFIVLMCLFLLTSCLYHHPMQEYTLKSYPSDENIKELFWEFKADFVAIAELLQANADFFYQHDHCLFPRKNYDYAEFFTDSEWQKIKEFLVLTGLLNIRLDTILVRQYEPDRRHGERIAFRFSAAESGVPCSLVFLSSTTDAEIKNKMIDDWYALHGRFNIVEMEELGEGWFLFTHHELPDTDDSAGSN